MTKRPYNSKARNAQAAITRARILSSAKIFFESEGFEHVTIEKIAEAASVSIPTVYALFQSKRGVLRALMDEALPQNEFHELVDKSIQEKCPEARLALSAKIARQIYDAERTQMSTFRGAAFLAPEFRELENEREKRRYERQEVTIKAMIKEHSLSKQLNATKARDILWALTGRDLYRMLVVDQGWSSNEYEKWLTQSLISSLIASNKDSI